MIHRHLMVYWRIPSFVCLIQLIRSDCEFPRQWWGRWYQPSVGDVIIRPNDISTKGTCYEQYRDYFLVENSREHCHQCLLILRRHANIIQYRESYCIGRDALQSFCNQMRVDRLGSTHTIVRDGALPVPCPLLKAFHFTYNNQSGGFCRSPTSYVHQCASSSMVRFNFKHCRHCLNAFDRGVEFECLATWRDGPDHFAYGRFLDNDDVHTIDDVRELSYRCFIYQKMGTVVNMAVSSDATCRSLRSPKDGPLVIEMTEDVYGWPSSRCTYPSSLKGSSWTEMSGRLTFTFNSANDVITIHSQRKHSGANTATTHARATLKCLKTDQSHNASSATFVAVDGDDVTGQISNYSNITVLAHVLEKCQSRHRCLRFQRRHVQLMHLYAGSYVRDVRVSCTDDDFSGEHSQHFLLIGAAQYSHTDQQHHHHHHHHHHHSHRGDDQTQQQQQQQRGSKCPLKGRYVPLRDESDTCQSEMRIGCLQHDQLLIVSSCQSQHPLLQLVCLFSWREHPSVFLVARRTDKNQTGCYHLQHHHSHFTIVASEHCSHYDNGGAGERSAAAAFVFQPVREKCREHVIRSEVENGGMKKASAVGGSGSGEGGLGADEDQTNDDLSLIRSTLGKETPSKREQYDSHLALGNRAAAAGAAASVSPSSSSQLSIVAFASIVCLFILRIIDPERLLCSAFSSVVVPRCRRNSGRAVRCEATDDIRCRVRSIYATQSGVS